MRYFFILIAFLMAAVTGCTQLETGAPLASSTQAGPPPVRIVNVDSYYSLYSHGPTLRMYVFADKRAVLKLTFSNMTRETEPAAELYLFDNSTDGEALDKWINNQHSDALYADAPEPQVTQDVSDKLAILSWRETGQKTGPSGESYATMEVRYSIERIATDRLAIDPFTDMAIVHVMTDEG